MGYPEGAYESAAAYFTGAGSEMTMIWFIASAVVLGLAIIIGGIHEGSAYRNVR